MRGRNFWGPGFWRWGYFGYPYTYIRLGGYFPWWGRGNPFPFCRRFPFLPRGWWWMYPLTGTFYTGYPFRRYI